jgi:hypothetical protein
MEHAIKMFFLLPVYKLIKYSLKFLYPCLESLIQGYSKLECAARSCPQNSFIQLSFHDSLP